MCGIVGVIGKAPAAPLLLEALRRLEYRGYDSAGIATLVNGHIERRRAEGKLVRRGAIIGPYARLRPGTEGGEGAHVGNFVELKKAQVAAGAKVNHLSYVGDAEVAARANIGAGTITCNYDGNCKYPTVIGEGAFIGSNTALVAPVTVGAGAIVGAGSVITADVEADSLAVERSQQKGVAGWARRFRERMTRRADS